MTSLWLWLEEGLEGSETRDSGIRGVSLEAVQGPRWEMKRARAKVEVVGQAEGSPGW